MPRKKKEVVSIDKKINERGTSFIKEEAQTVGEENVVKRKTYNLFEIHRKRNRKRGKK